MALLTTVGALLVAWSLLVPAWESSEEPQHWQYANYLHDHLSLPPYDAAHIEGNEPPLYYLLISPIAGDGMNPQIDYVAGPGGRGYYPEYPRLYHASAHDLSDYAPLHVARLVTAGISLLTVLFTYLAGLEATGRRATGLVAGMLIGFLPMFTFRGTSVSCDAMVAMVCALGTYLIVRLHRRGFSWRLGLAIGVTAGLALLSKVTGGVLLVGAATAILTIKPFDWRTRLRQLAPLLIAVVMLSPWLLYNQVTYGDPLAHGQVAAAVPGIYHPHSLFSDYFVLQFPSLLILTSFGNFGWTDLPLPTSLQLVYEFVFAVALSGLVLAIRHKTESWRLLLTLLAIVIATIGAVVVINMTVEQPQGRFLFPGLAAIGILGAIGLEAIPGWRRHPNGASAGLAALLVALQIYILAAVIVPAYATA